MFISHHLMIENDGHRQFLMGIMMDILIKNSVKNFITY